MQGKSAIRQWTYLDARQRLLPFRHSELLGREFGARDEIDARERARSSLASDKSIDSRAFTTTSLVTQTLRNARRTFSRVVAEIERPKFSFIMNAVRSVDSSFMVVMNA